MNNSPQKGNKQIITEEDYEDEEEEEEEEIEIISEEDEIEIISEEEEIQILESNIVDEHLDDSEDINNLTSKQSL